MTSAHPQVLEPVGEEHAVATARTGLPSRFCGRCMSVVYHDDHRCLECGRARPPRGWQRLRHSGDPWLGQIMVGRYLITRRLGKGASATVYEAESLNISRQFAIKVVDLSSRDGDKDPALIRARLDREIEAISRLQNPHTVPFYEVISLSDACVGIVMKFVKGQTLVDVLACQAPLDWRRATSLLRQLAIGLHEAHEVGLIHRDLKPANIMVERLCSGDEFIHVLDFGIVWIDDGLEVTRGFVGTPLYASPEQALGENVDRRSDIYSLGAIFFEMLTGRTPFESKNVIEVLRMHVRHTPPTLADALESQGHDLRAFPPAVEHLVERMLSKSREARPFDLTEVIDALDDLLLENSERVGDTKERGHGADALAMRSVGRCDSGALAQTADGLGVLVTMRGDHENSSSIASSERARDDDAWLGEVDQEPGAIGDFRSEGFFERPHTGKESVVARKFLASRKSVARKESLGSRESFFESEEHDATGPKAAIFRPGPAARPRSVPPRAP